MKKTFVVIPAYNEELHIAKVIKKTKKYAKNIIIVDDGSNDNTVKIAENTGVTVLKHVVNLGKGSSLKTGCDFAIRMGAEKIIVMDSDGQHDPQEIPRFEKGLAKKDIVFGSRSLNKKMPVILKTGNKIINGISNFLFGIQLKDTQSGFRAFTRAAYRKIRWESQDYSVESEIIANAGKSELKYKEIKIKTIYSDKYKGTTIIDGVKIVLNMIWWRIRWG